MDWIDVVGHIGSALSSLTFMPQVYQTWNSKSVGDLNLMMLLIVFSSTIIWLVYGIGRMLWPVIICNAIICLLSVVLIWLKLKYQKK